MEKADKIGENKKKDIDVVVYVDGSGDEICYGREDLMRVAENIANEVGEIDIAEDLCEVMAKAAADFVNGLLSGGTYSYTPY